MIANGAFAAIGTDLFISNVAKVPDGDGPYGTIVPNGGEGPTRVHGAGRPKYLKPGVAVIVRAKSATAARAKAVQAMAAADVQNETVNGTAYLWVRPTRSEPTEMLPDEKG